MFRSLLDLDVQPRFRTVLNELIMEEGRVAGAKISGPDGEKQVHTRAGVILATGGFARNADYRKRLMPEPTPPVSLACECNQGDGLRLAEALGARVSDTENGCGGFWTPVSCVTRRDGSEGVFPHLSLDRGKPGIIAVNSNGRRFCNEADSYHDFVKAMYRNTGNARSIPAWLICDRKFIRKYGVGLVYPGTRNLSQYERSGYVKTGTTPEQLAGRIGIDPAALRATLARYNEQAQLGVDKDFHRGHSELNRFNGDPEVRPNPCVAPIDESALCAVEVWPAEIACSAGLSADRDAQVVDKHETPIPGLFACGNDMASIMGDSYPGPGTTLGPAVVFAYRAVERAAQDVARFDSTAVVETKFGKPT
jgi:succinate dehydrogenase/fumarate reductase flavoprotein subunit